jgi:hypothetical protein
MSKERAMNRLIAGVALCGWILGLFAGAVLAAPDTWDSRLTDLGVCCMEANPAPGTWYWKLTSGVYEDETQSGGAHNIYYKCLNDSGQPVENQMCWAAWGNTGSAVPCPVIPNPPDGTASMLTKGPVDGYWANYPLAGGWCPFWPTGPHGGYGAWVDGPSDQVWGMGMPCNRHVNYRYTWKWSKVLPPKPIIARSPASFTKTVRQGQGLADDTFTVWNTGAPTLSYTISDNAAWLSETPMAGTCTTETDTIAIHYSVSGLAWGNYAATITIADPNSSNLTQTIAVSLVVQEVVFPGDFDHDTDVDQTDFGYFQACLTGNGYEQTDPLCGPAMLDADVDVDALDFDIFLRCLSGAGVPGDPTCAQGQ